MIKEEMVLVISSAKKNGNLVLMIETRCTMVLRQLAPI
jgi:hypothetical protein